MLETRGRLLLAVALGLCAVGVILALPAPLLVGALITMGLLGELLRLRRGLRGHALPWGVRATLRPRRGEASVAGLDVRSHRLGQPSALELELSVLPAFSGLEVELRSWCATAGIEVAAREARVLLSDARPVTVEVEAIASTAAVHRVFGLEVRLLDARGLLAASVFLPCPHELAVLPRSLAIDPRCVPETRRRVVQAVGGQRPDQVAGSGDEIRELREHLPGDPFKHIAWKATARRGRLMSRVFEHERARALYVVLDTGSSMRDGRIGQGPLDQALDLVHSLAERAARQRVPMGLGLVDGRLVEQRPVCEGLAALRGIDRALLEVRRAVAEDLTPLEEEALLEVVVDYLRAVEGLRLSRGELDYVSYRQRAVMAALARLPPRERSPLLRGPEPSVRADLSILRRFCRAMDLSLPYRQPLPGLQRVAGLRAGAQAALRARRGPFVLLVISDFRGLAGLCEPLWQILALAGRRGHRALVLALREVEDRDLLALVADAEDAGTARGLVRADATARQMLLDELWAGCRRVGAGFLEDPLPAELLAAWAEGL